MSVDALLVDDVHRVKDTFAKFLRGRKYKKNSVRSYVNYSRILLAEARALGWTPNANASRSWQPVIALAVAQNCEDLARDLARKQTKLLRHANRAGRRSISILGQ